MNLSARYHCPHCGERLEIWVDPSAGALQSYVEDCHVCCRPNLLTVRIGSDGSARVTAEPESA